MKTQSLILTSLLFIIADIHATKKIPYYTFSITSITPQRYLPVKYRVHNYSPYIPRAVLKTIYVLNERVSTHPTFGHISPKPNNRPPLRLILLCSKYRIPISVTTRNKQRMF